VANVNAHSDNLGGVLITDPLHSQDVIHLNNLTVSQLTSHDIHLV
jgi:hypothetical protein